MNARPTNLPTERTDVRLKFSPAQVDAITAAERLGGLRDRDMRPSKISLHTLRALIDAGIFTINPAYQPSYFLVENSRSAYATNPAYRPEVPRYMLAR
jgi:hypothetical protein